MSDAELRAPARPAVGGWTSTPSREGLGACHGELLYDKGAGKGILMSESARNVSMDRYFEDLYRRREPLLKCSVEEQGAFYSWRGQFRAMLEYEMGGYPTEKVDAEPQITETHDEGDYLRERLVIRTEPEMNVPSWLLTPKAVRSGERRAAVLALHGHGGGKDDLCGVAADEASAKRIEDHNYDYARSLVKRGYIVLAPDHRGFGERRVGYDTWQTEGGDRRDPCNVLLLKAMLFGKNLLLLNVWDVMKCLDYLASRPDVDEGRIGACGLSYGGTVTLFAAALDDRIKAAVVSCYLSSFEDYALRMSNFCGNQTPTGLLRLGEMEDVGCCVAPRALMAESGRSDGGFPIEAARRAAEPIGRLYSVLGVPDQFRFHEFDGGHMWSGAGEQFLDQCL
jgi:dienelactone hydrolase